MNLLNDIYYKKEYIELYLKDKEAVFEYRFEEGEYVFTNLAIKRPISKINDTQLKEIYYDLETAYGYGGIYSNTTDKVFLNKAFSAYSAYCKGEKIIADFSRVHPFNETHKEIKEFFDLYILDRKTVVVDSKLNEEKRWATYPTKIRTILRKCKKELIFRKSEDINTFLALYNETMKKNNADAFYFFDKQYFEKLISNPNIELYEVLIDDIVISATFVLFGEEIGHYHLSANNYEFRKHNANYFILDSLFNIAHQKGKKYFLLGGGRINAADDNLLRFKKKFSPLEKDFYIMGIVHNKEIYSKYCEIWEKTNNSEIRYFLKYRLENE